MRLRELQSEDPSTGSARDARISPAAVWRPEFARIRWPVYLAIADHIEDAIRLGVLRPGDRLPTQRDIADDLGFHLNTVNAAFREAARRGLIESRTRRGSIVSVSPAHQGSVENPSPSSGRSVHEIPF
ncbi:GntR family transcriptional regulator [Paraburkholderia adhaesiva]|uniref:GntR family transcriptional regulator n=1 Tax=Paraburkholderia adhaesiva TaxID=2883244 RepID=UPI001F3E8D3B|nr:GntR family transcriptional regulator [Paraburkholderia adhaesiva]